MREAHSVDSIAAARFLEFFGVEPTGNAPPSSGALGDVLLGCGRGLGLAPGRPTLTSALIVEREDGTHCVGDVVADGSVDALATWAGVHLDAITIVADAVRSPQESMAEGLRKRLGVGVCANVCGVLTSR